MHPGAKRDMKRDTGIWGVIVVLMIMEEYGKKKEGNDREKNRKIYKA